MSQGSRVVSGSKPLPRARIFMNLDATPCLLAAAEDSEEIEGVAAYCKGCCQCLCPNPPGK